MQGILQAVKDSTHCTQDRAKTYANNARKEIVFEDGDFIYLKVPAKLET